MQVIFDPDIPEDLKEEVLKAIEDEKLDLCKECGANVIYVAMIDNTLDVKCYECGASFFEIELSEE